MPQHLQSSLRERVHELLELHRDRKLGSTTGVNATVDELALRNRGLEQALLEIASEIDRLADRNDEE